MPRGRKPKPTSLKLIQGTARKDRLPKSEPRPEGPIRCPAAPDFLSKEALAEWRRVGPKLAKLGLLTDMDRGTFAAYCQAYGRSVQADLALARFAEKDAATHGIIMKSKSGNAVLNPLVRASRQAWETTARLAAEFGLTPASRGRISVDKPTDPSDPASRFFGG